MPRPRVRLSRLTDGKVDRVADYKSTVNLPQTDFAMKADLARREPAMQQWWEQNDIYGELRRVAKGRPRFALHDGPPYANGAIHLAMPSTRS